MSQGEHIRNRQSGQAPVFGILALVSVTLTGLYFANIPPISGAEETETAKAASLSAVG